MTKAILFDFFGTLVEYSTSRTEQGYHNTYALLQTQLHPHQIELPYEDFLLQWDAVSEELVVWSAAHQREFFMQDVADRFLARLVPGKIPSEFSRQLGKAYIKEWSKAVVYPPDVRAFLTDLATRFKLVLVTNTHDPEMVHGHLDAMGITALFDAIITSPEHGRPKPHPSIFHAALEAINSEPSQAVFVGDSFEADYQGATAIGLPAYLIDPEKRHDIPVENRLMDVFELTRRLNN